jgi:flagellar biosynthesis/type III secretory pathway protein FliH
MMTASAEQNMETGSVDYPLDPAEILRLVKASRQAGYNPSQEDYFAKPQEFRPVSLKDMAKINSQNATKAAEAPVQAPHSDSPESPTTTDAATDTIPQAEEVAVPRERQSAAIPSDDQTPSVQPEATNLDAEDENLPPPADASSEDNIDSIGEQVNMAAQKGDTPNSEDKASFDEIKVKMDAVSKLKPESETTADSADYQRGVEDGRKAALAEKEQEMSEAIAAFHDAAEAIGHDDNIDLSQLSSAMNKAIITLASERAGLAIDSHPDAFAQKIEAMVTRIRNRVDDPVIYLNPADAKLISASLKDNLAPRSMKIIADDQLKRGDARIDVGSIGVMDLIDANHNGHHDDNLDPKDPNDD